MKIIGDEMFDRLVREMLAEDPGRNVTLNRIKAVAASHGATLEVEIFVRCRPTPVETIESS